FLLWASVAPQRKTPAVHPGRGFPISVLLKAIKTLSMKTAHSYRADRRSFECCIFVAAPFHYAGAPRNDARARGKRALSCYPSAVNEPQLIVTPHAHAPVLDDVGRVPWGGRALVCERQMASAGLLPTPARSGHGDYRMAEP